MRVSWAFCCSYDNVCGQNFSRWVFLFSVQMGRLYSQQANTAYLLLMFTYFWWSATPISRQESQMYEHSATLPTSNTMQPKVVLVVSRTHWRCLTCKLLNRRVVSIDQHLKSIHPGLGLAPTAPFASSFDRCCHSDGELETAFQYSDVVHAGKSSEARIKKEEATQNVLQLQRDLSEPVSYTHLTLPANHRV